MYRGAVLFFPMVGETVNCNSHPASSTQQPSSNSSDISVCYSLYTTYYIGGHQSPGVSSSHSRWAVAASVFHRYAEICNITIYKVSARNGSTSKKKSQGSFFFYYYFSSSYRRNYQRDQCNRISVAPYFKSIQHIITTARRYEPACRFQKSHPGYREIYYIHIYEKKRDEIVICSSYLKKSNRWGKKKNKGKKFATDLGNIIGKRRKKNKEHQPGKERTPTFPASALRRRKVPFL